MTQVEVQAFLGPVRHTSKRQGVEENWYLPSPPLDVASFDSPFGYGAVLVGFKEGRVVSKKLNPRIQAPVVPLLEDNRDESFSLFVDPLKGK